MQAPFRQLPLAARLAFIPAFYLVNTGVLYFLGSFIAHQFMGIEDTSALMQGTFSTEHEAYVFLFLQALFSLGGFMLSAVLFTYFETGTVKQSMHLNRWPHFRLLLLALLAILAAQPLIELLVQLSKSLTSAPALQPLRDIEQKEEVFMEKLLQFTSLGRFFVTATVIALVPALSEEFFFRGLIMRTLLRSKMNVALSIIVTGFIFALVHMQLSNFVAIWVLGSFLGYLYYISGSLWLPIMAHFINNFLTVLFKYLFNNGYLSSDLANASTPLWLTILGTVIFGLCIFMFYKWQEKAEFADIQLPINTEPTLYE
ncbi:MAG: CPBP family intramembrane glutamic endopeptidase [Chitinophagales bacterium]